MSSASDPDWSRAEVREALCWAALLAVLTSVPSLYALWNANSTSREWTGLQLLSPLDVGVYLHYISQAARGSWFISNPFTTEAGTPTVHIVWLAIGRFAAMLGISPLAAFQLSRILLLIPFCLVLSWSVGRFLPERRERRAALALLLVGSGLGGVVRRIVCDDPYCGSGMDAPPDLWVGEFNPFLSASYTPHFVVSWTLLILSITSAYCAFREYSMRYAAVGGIASLILFQFHPFYAPVVWGIGLAFAVLAVRERIIDRLPIRELIVFMGLGLPSFAYHAWIAVSTTNQQWLFEPTRTQAPHWVLLGLGAFANAAYRGSSLLRRRSDSDRRRATYLVTWIVLQSVLLYAPVSFNRRFLEGFLFPFAILSAPAVLAFIDIVQGWRRVARAIVLAAVFLPSTVDALARNYELYRGQSSEMFFHSAEEARALEWIRDRIPHDAVFLSSFPSGYILGGWGERRVYAGHWAQTIDRERKKHEIAAFFSAWSDRRRLEFLKAQGITHVYVGPRERAIGADFASSASLLTLYRDGEFAVYAVP